MALSGVKLDSESSCFVSDCFPVRGLIKRNVNEGDGAWIVAHRAEQRRRFKAVLCAKPRTYSRIREERKRAEEERVPMTASNIVAETDTEEKEAPVLDGYFMLKHCCVEDPSDLCSVNIAGQELSEVKEEDFEIFDSVAYVNAGENFLPFEAFRGFPSLRELEMPLNGLRNLRIDGNDFPKLEVLDVSYNNLSHEDILTLGSLPALRVLHLTGNNFRSLPAEMSVYRVSPDKQVQLQKFRHLEVLLLDDNKLSDVSVFAALAGLPKLRHVNMEKNEISYVPQLKCIEGRVMTHGSTRSDGSRSDGSHRQGRVSSRHGSRSSIDSVRGEKAAEKLEAAESVPEAGNAITTAPQQPDTHTKEEADFERHHNGQLLNDDFSLGELGDRITELEEETAKVNMQLPNEPKSARANDGIKPFPPFPELRYLNLAYNQIQDEDALLAVAAWPMVVHLVIHNNPLTKEHAGDPPLLKRFLTDRLGIKLQRKEKPLLVKPHIEVPITKSRIVSELVPKVPRSTVEERIQQLALEAPKPTPAVEPQQQRTWQSEDRTLSGLDLETSKRMPLPPILPTPPKLPPTPRTQAWAEAVKSADGGGRQKVGEVRTARPDSEAFFMTQVEDQVTEEERKAQQQELQAEEKTTATAYHSNVNNNYSYSGYELLLEGEDDQVELEMQLPKDIQGNVRALKHALNYGLVYRDSTVDLDHVRRPVPEYRRVPQPPPKVHVTRQEKIDELLKELRTRTTVEEVPLNAILKNPIAMHKHYVGARELLGKVQKRYNCVRVSSMKEAADARKIIDQAFEVVKQPKQTYKSSA